MAALIKHVERLIGRLGQLTELGTSDKAAISALPFEFEKASAGQTIVQKGDVATRCCFLLEGHACRYASGSGGERQIVGFHLPGDLMNAQHILMPLADHSLEMMTQGKVAWIPIEALRTVSSHRPAIAEALSRSVLVDASVSREWTLNIGSRNARSRIAHMLCEFVVRQSVLRNPDVDPMRIPMTQQQIGEATGLTSVHVNRMLRVLAELGVLVRGGRGFLVSDLPKLKTIACFDPVYLHGTA